MGDENPIRTLGDYSKPSHEGYRNTIELPVGNNVNDPRDFAKPVKAIALPQDVPSISDRRLIELKIIGPHDTQYSMKDPEQAFVEYASSRTDETGEDDGEVMFIEIIQDDDEPQNEGPNKGEGTATEGPVIEYFDTFPTRDELTYHKKLNHREDVNRGVSNFTRRIKGMHVFIGNFTYIMDFMIIEDISSIIDPRLSQVVLGKPFVEISNMTYDPQEGVVRFTNKNDKVAYKMPHKIKQYKSLSNLEKEHTKSVYLRNEEDKRSRVEYVISKILGFYKQCPITSDRGYMNKECMIIKKFMENV
ncbi:hypothetical protein Tco_0108993 [Tanacetum coccineum]